MSEYLVTAFDIEVSSQLAGETSLVFVDDADYEFVGGGAAVTNGL